MANLKLKGKDLLKLGFPNNQSINVALEVMKRNYATKNLAYVKSVLEDILKNPAQYEGHLTFGQIAEALLSSTKTEKRQLNSLRAPYHIFGEDITEEAKTQLYTALKLPISVGGALMPDAQSGYGCLSILDIPVSYLSGARDKYEKALAEHTKFGMYETHKSHVEHEIFDRDTFSLIPILKRLKDKAIKQMGTSGSGNHFVEFGEVELLADEPQIGLPKGKYLGILSHSGSRGFGAEIAQYYVRVAAEQCPLPKEAQQFAWLDLSTHLGLEYWTAMNLAGDYASACHDDIHRRLIRAVGGRLRARIENHHNFAWKEFHNGKEVVVHRKGATPAGEGVLGIIPASMTDAGYIVRGKGNAESFSSASHGAGRAFSRNESRNRFTSSDIKKALKAKDITLIGGNAEEAPMAYKNIETVMQSQRDLVEVIGRFQPRIVRMDK